MSSELDDKVGKARGNYVEATCPHYSTDIAAAWGLVEEMVAADKGSEALRIATVDKGRQELPIGHIAPRNHRGFLRNVAKRSPVLRRDFAERCK